MNTNVMQPCCEITNVSTIGDRLKQAREALGLSQGDVAGKAGVSQGTIGNLESGLRKNPRELLAIAAAVGVSPVWLKTGKHDALPATIATDTPAHPLPEPPEVPGAALPPALATRLAKLSEAQRAAVLRSLAGLLDALEAPAEPPLGAPIAPEHLATLQKLSDDAQTQHAAQQQGHRTARR
jgi:transcriptional regulator with XRE-family HTH domain